MLLVGVGSLGASSTFAVLCSLPLSISLDSRSTVLNFSDISITGKIKLVLFLVTKCPGWLVLIKKLVFAKRLFYQFLNRYCFNKLSASKLVPNGECKPASLPS